MDYSKLYRKLNRRTPMKYDCGKLCNGICCKDDKEERLGMYLFPGEDGYIKNEKGYETEDSDFLVDNKPVKILYCDGSCRRNMRPISCRIFPLFPYVTKEGDLKVIVDIRARGVCPLYKLDIKDFSHSFVRGVYHMGKMISEDPCGFSYLYSLSRLIDETAEDLAKEITMFDIG